MIWLGAAPPEGYEHLVEAEMGSRQYTLKEGDTIFSVARKVGVHHQLIAKANHIEDYGSLEAGQVLVIPARDWVADDEATVSEPEPIQEVVTESREEVETSTLIDEVTTPPDVEPTTEEAHETLISDTDLQTADDLLAVDDWAAEETETPAFEQSSEPEVVPPLEIEDADSQFLVDDWAAEETETPAFEQSSEPEIVPPLEIEDTDSQFLVDDWAAEETETDAFEQIQVDDEVSPLQRIFEPEPVSVESEPPTEESPSPPIETLLPDFEAELAAEAYLQAEDTSSVETDDVFRYEIQRGDTLNAIARRYGLTVKELVEANEISDPSHTFPGQKLIIPGYMSQKPQPVLESKVVSRPIPDTIGEHFLYMIASGDTLSSIAKRYGITLRELIEVNEIDNPNLIRAGQKLIIPGIFTSAAATPEPTPTLPEVEPPPPPSSQSEPTQSEPALEAKPSISFNIDPDFPPVGPMDAVRAMYVSYFAIGHADKRQHVLKLLDSSEFNAVVIDVKGDFGLISYPTHIPLAREINADQPTAKDFDKFMAALKERDIYTIARIVSFKDTPLAKNYPEFAVKTNTGQIWQDREQQSWSDPFLRPVWDYNIQLAIEAAKMGFNEIQFDYVRFPTPSHAGAPYFSQEMTKAVRVAAITGFLSAARGQLKPLGVKIAADTFGYTCWREDDTVIGQDIERMAQYLDVLCPMLYPSTFGSGIPGYKFAIAHPYEVVYLSAARAVERLKTLSCDVRPWIQDFPDYRFDKRVYGKNEIQAQIKGSFDSGSTGFMVWDPRIQYTNGAYAPIRMNS